MATARGCRVAADRGATWLEKEFSLDSEVQAEWEAKLDTFEFGNIFKGPFAFALSGRHDAGNRLLDFIVAKYQPSPGEFTPQPTSVEPSFASLMRWYMHSVVLIGAAALSRWDVASSQATKAIKHQIVGIGDQHGLGATGGIGEASGRYLGVTPTAMAGMYLLQRAEFTAAEKLARFVITQQRADTNVFHLIYDTVNKKVVRTTDEVPAWLKERQCLYCIDPTKERQHSFAAGIGSAFLAEMATSISDSDPTFAQQCFESARALVAFDMRCTWEGPFKQWPSKCKGAWGAANLLAWWNLQQHQPHANTTPKDDVVHDSKRARVENGVEKSDLRTYTEAVAQNTFLTNQSQDGDFGVYHFPLHDHAVENLPAGTIHWSDVAAQTGLVHGDHYVLGTKVELCSEFVYELMLIARGLAATK